MTAPIIQEGLYSLEKTAEYQAILNKNYEDIEPLKSGRYPSKFGIESEQLADGYGYLETAVINEKLPFELLLEVAKDKPHKIRFVQPIPERFLNENNRGINAFAIYIRYSLPKDEPIKLRIKKEPMLGTPAI